MLGGKGETPDAGAGLDNGGPIGTPGSSNQQTSGGRTMPNHIEGGGAAPMVQVLALGMSAIMRGAGQREDHS
jgi:hypothetical protein